jgi:hypothetical protein
MPHRLDTGASETWAVDVQSVLALVNANAETFQIPARTITVRGKVELGDRRRARRPIQGAAQDQFVASFRTCPGLRPGCPHGTRKYSQRVLAQSPGRQSCDMFCSAS